jgi:hypothetical protein
MRLTPKIVLVAVLSAFVTTFLFPVVLFVSKASAKSATWGEIKCIYGGCSNTNSPPPPPPPPPKD